MNRYVVTLIQDIQADSVEEAIDRAKTQALGMPDIPCVEDHESIFVEQLIPARPFSTDRKEVMYD